MRTQIRLLLVCLVLILLPQLIHAQIVPYKMVYNKVVFSDTTKTKLKKEQIESNLKAMLVNQDYNEGSTINAAGDSVKVFSLRMTDFLKIEKRKLSVFALLMRYFLVMEIKDNRCVTTLTNISYIEPDEYEKKIRLKNYKFDVIPAEMVFVEKNYKSLFTTNASEKIIHKTYERVDELFGTIKTAVKR